MMSIIQTGSLFLLLLIIQCNGIPRFANYIQDHMVLQRAPQRAVVWGYGDPSTETSLMMNDKTYTTISQSEAVNAQGESIWSVTLDAVSDEGPFDIHVSQPLANGTLVTITLHDILFGDVWLCSGQSNMQLTVSLIYNATEEIANAGNYPKIRVFTASLNQSDGPLEELLGIVSNWSVASPHSIGGRDWQYMSAVCWLYGRMIHQGLDGRPIGLIAASWAGTSIQVWMPPEALEQCNETKNENMIIQSDYEPFGGIPGNHSYLYNAMIHPFTRIVIYGVIWYQGEGNGGGSDDHNEYTCLFANMIRHWRQIWNNRTNGISDIQFPFGFVQLSTEPNTSTGIASKTWVRWHQTFDIGYVPNSVVPKVFMAVACDLRDDPHGVHPRYKHDVGYRLSRSGLAVAYGQPVEFQGPIVQTVDYFNGSGALNITYTAVSSMDLRNPNGFEVCCLGRQCLNDYIWVPAIISKKNNLTITLTIDNSCVGQQLYGVRYLWRETPCLFKQAALYSSTDPNLPSPPYLKIF